MASLRAGKKTVPFKLLTDIEKDLKSFVEYGSEHGASKMLIPVKVKLMEVLFFVIPVLVYFISLTDW